MPYGQLVIGPAGSGKSTYCSAMVDHASNSKRTIDVINLDPAAEYFDYEPLIDIRDLIKIDEVMDDIELSLGPNGGLIYCIEYLFENSEWLKVRLDDIDEDQYFLIDCPGQIELYTHLPVMLKITNLLQSWNISLCSVFLLDSHFITDASKFISATMTAMSVMVNLGLPHVNILSKVDLLATNDRNKISMYLEPDNRFLMDLIEKDDSQWFSRHRKFTESYAKLIQDYSLVSFYPLNLKDFENVSDILFTIDMILQYGETTDVQTRDFDEPDPED